MTVAADLLSAGAADTTGRMGADIVFGRAQRFGVPMGYGGAARRLLRHPRQPTSGRLTPGRIIGVSVDSQGRPALRMALQTREQHIRREKATSNICTAQVLLANHAGFYGAYHGPRRVCATSPAAFHRMACVWPRACAARLFELGDDSVFRHPDGACARQAGRSPRAPARPASICAVRRRPPGRLLRRDHRRGDLKAGLWRVFGGQGFRGASIDVDARDAAENGECIPARRCAGAATI